MNSTVAIESRDAIVDVAIDLAQRELRPQTLALDERRAGAVEAAWQSVCDIGFDHALAPTTDGGVGLEPATLLACLEEIAAGDGGIAMLVLLANAATLACPDAAAADGERWALVPVPPPEVPSGVDLAVGAGGEVDGVLAPALGALAADGVVVIDMYGASPTAIAIRSDAAGMSLEPCEPQLGLRAAANARIVLSAATAHVSSALEAAAGARSLALLRAGTAAIARGTARHASELARAYAQTRIQGGVPIIEHDAVRDMLAAMEIRLRACRLNRDEEPLDELAALAAKVSATDAAVATTTDAVQVFGGAGYMHETGAEKLMRDAKHCQLFPEPNWVAAASLMRVR